MKKVDFQKKLSLPPLRMCEFTLLIIPPPAVGGSTNATPIASDHSVGA